MTSVLLAFAMSFSARAEISPKIESAEFVAIRAGKVLSELKARPVRSLQAAVETQISASPTKASWLQSIYAKKLVDASWATAMLADKRILYEVLRLELGPKDAARFYPRTIGLREFLQKRGLLNASGALVAAGERIEEALNAEFSAGFVARPAVGVAPRETGKGLYAEPDRLIVELLKPGNGLYAQQNVRSHILDTIASGEAVVLQEDVVLRADSRKKLKARYFQEVRIHTYEDRVVEGAVPERWVQTNLLKPEQVRAAKRFVGDFLTRLPFSVTGRQAWGVDVAVMDNGEMRIIDVVTNRGEQVAWSGYLDQPRVIAAYAKHFEDRFGVRFTGVSGGLIRHGFANYLAYWQKRIDHAKPGVAKALAYIPPVP